MAPSPYENVVVGKLKLKGKLLDVMGGASVGGGGISHKRKKPKKHFHFSQSRTGGRALMCSDTATDIRSGNDIQFDDGRVDDASASAPAPAPSSLDGRLTPAERRYLQQREKVELERLAKMASKSHRDRIQEFNQYLANLSEHYDIPKVGPG